MKFNRFIFISIVLIAITYSEISCAFLKIKRGDKTPEYIEKEKKLNYQLPATYQKGAEYQHKDAVATKAGQQVAAARNLLKKPNDAAKLILKTAAEHLRELWNNDIVKENEKTSDNFNRSIFGGILDAAANAAESKLSAADKGNASKKEAARLAARVNAQIERISKVATLNNPKATDYAAVLAILGDMGTAAFDCNPVLMNLADKPGDDAKQKKKNAKTRATHTAYCNMRGIIFRKFFQNLEERNCMATDFIPMALKTRGGSAIAPNKKAVGGNPPERSMVMLDADTPKLDERGGLLVDGLDGNRDGFKAKWPWQLIPEIYMKECAEPWAGHYSGSILEVLFMLDVTTKANNELGKDHPMRSWQPDEYLTDPRLKSQKCKDMFNNIDIIGHDKLASTHRKCKAALAGAFLISIGYHSAVEVRPTIWAFLNLGKIKQDPQIFSMGNQVCDTVATEKMVQLMQSCTKTN